MIPKKVELLIRSFEPFGTSRVFHFSFRTFAEVEHHPGPLVASDETYTQTETDISGSNETMQNAPASIVKLWRIFEIFFIFTSTDSSQFDERYFGTAEQNAVVLMSLLFSH